MLYLEKNLYFLEASYRSYTFWKPHIDILKQAKNHIHRVGHPLRRNGPLKNWKFLSFLASFISKIKIAEIFNFLSVKYFGKGLLFMKLWLIRVNYCWNDGPLNLAFRFFRFGLGHLNNRQTNIAENSTTYFWKLTPKQVFGESFKSFDPTTTKWRSFKFLCKIKRKPHFNG